MFNFQKAIQPTVSVYSNNTVKLAQSTVSKLGVTEELDYIIIAKVEDENSPNDGKVLIATMNETNANLLIKGDHEVRKLNKSFQINSKYIANLLTGKGANWKVAGTGQLVDSIEFFEMICEEEGTIEVAKAKKVEEIVEEEFQVKEPEEEMCTTVDDVL